MKKIVFTVSLIALNFGIVQAHDSYDEFVNKAFSSTGYTHPGSLEAFHIKKIRAAKYDSFFAWLRLEDPKGFHALAETRKFVRQSSYDQAYQQTKSYAVAKCVSRYISEQLAKTEEGLTDPTQPPIGAYSSFVGRKLHVKIASAIAQCQQDQYAPSAPPEAVESELHSVYYTPDNKKTNEAARTSDPDPCCICTEVYGEAQRVYFPRWGGAVRESGLYQTCCGHWACVDCTLRWFSSENKSTCPFCRSQVDKRLLEKILSSR